ncbi:MAG TPA: hypothetical protein VFX33_02430 [Actinomycetales bacterium]|nr:hypothetical protein [Actinomycetales bacterium]
MTQGPLAPGDPVQVGPFEVRGRWRTGEAGSVLAAVAPDGRPVDLVVLGAGPSTDAATCDRFAAAVERITSGRPGLVLGAAPAAPVPWVALPGGTTTRTSDSDLASELLGSALPPGPREDPGEATRGPRFAPYWHGRTYTRPAPPLLPAADGAPVPEAATATRRWWLVAIIVALLLLLLALLWLLLAQDRTSASDPQPVPGITATPHATPDLVPSPAPSGSPTDSPSVPPTSRPTGPVPGTGGSPSGPGVLGPGFGPQDDTYTVRLEGLAFSFEIPGSWGCMRSDDPAGPDAAVRWLCMDEGWLLDDTGGIPPGGVVQQEPCPEGCAPEQWAALRQKEAPGVRWSQADATTLIHEDVALDETGGSRYLIRMSHVFAAAEGAGGQPDTHVYVSLSVPVEMRKDAWNVVQSIRENTP